MAKIWLIEFVMTKVAEGSEAEGGGGSGTHKVYGNHRRDVTHAEKNSIISSTLRATDIV